MSSSPTKRTPVKATGTRQRARKERIAPFSNPHPPNPINTLLSLGTLTLFLPVVSLATLASKLALHPLYGSTATSLHFVKVLAGSCALATIRPDLPVHIALLFLGTLLSASPFTARWLGAWTSRWHDPIWGPVVTQMGIVMPIVGLSVVLARSRIVSNSFFSMKSELIPISHLECPVSEGVAIRNFSLYEFHCIRFSFVYRACAVEIHTPRGSLHKL
jgi:hypothetical protein